MKTKGHRISSILLGSTLVLGLAGVSQAGPSPDLMNSISRMRLEAQKSSMGIRAILDCKNNCTKGRSGSETRNISAGQSTVAVPELSRPILKSSNRFEVAPMK